MTRHYCTLFDSNYLAKGLVLHESLQRHSSEQYLLHILAMDIETAKILDEMALPNVSVMPLSDFERMMHLEPVRESRSWKEYCWTLASSLMEMLVPWVGDITYVDSDIMFFSDPQVIFEEIGQRSIAIVPHRFNDRDRVRLARNGEYNVGIVSIRDTETGRRCITKWAKQCRDWCFARNEAGKFGDQGYLDRFPADYPGEVRIIENLGVNLGPWSIGNFKIAQQDRDVFVNHDRLVAYHFHEYKNPEHLTNWPLRQEDRELIYKPYIAAMHVAQARIANIQKRLRQHELDMEAANRA